MFFKKIQQFFDNNEILIYKCSIENWVLTQGFKKEKIVMGINVFFKKKKNGYKCIGRMVDAS